MTKNEATAASRQTVTVQSQEGENIGLTYPRRAAGLVRKGRARFVNDNLDSMTNFSDLEQEIINAITQALDGRNPGDTDVDEICSDVVEQFSDRIDSMVDEITSAVESITDAVEEMRDSLDDIGDM